MSDKPLSEEQWAQIKQALMAGNKIEAIKLYREFTNLGLKESKDAVDKLDEELKTSGLKIVAPAGSGCFGMFLLCALAAIAAMCAATAG